MFLDVYGTVMKVMIKIIFDMHKENGNHDTTNKLLTVNILFLFFWKEDLLTYKNLQKYATLTWTTGGTSELIMRFNQGKRC